MILTCANNWADIENEPFEIVERKGLGHPDTLADGLAEAVSIEYSNYCLKHFGCIPHHNVDKLYIGGGLFSVAFGNNHLVKPVKIRINGRMSNCFGQEGIDLITLQRKAVQNYLSRILPRSVLDQNVVIEHNATQHTKIKNWFSPQSKEDLPELKNLRANDTSVCVAHAPLSTTEKICMLLEKYFWNVDKNGQASSPKFSDLGQDIKVMVIRNEKNIRANLCVPVLSDTVQSEKEYRLRSEELETELNDLMQRQDFYKNYNISIKVNDKQTYILGLGSCIECGEEGIVGRGNGISGLIPVMRAKSNEAFFGKNPVYHVGRVLGLLTQRLSNRIYQETGSANSVYTLAVHSHELLPPTNVCISLQDITVKDKIEPLIYDEFSKETYLRKILEHTQTDNFSLKLL